MPNHAENSKSRDSNNLSQLSDVVKMLEAELYFPYSSTCVTATDTEMRFQLSSTNFNKKYYSFQFSW